MSVRERLNAFTKFESMIECKRVQYARASAALTGPFDTADNREQVEKINADIARLEAERDAVMYMIDNTPTLTDAELDLLYKHYLEGLSYEALAVLLHYATTSVFRKCKKATQKVADHWENT